jgi:hypothetical protein
MKYAWKKANNQGRNIEVETMPLDDTSELLFYVWEINGMRYGGIRRFVYSDAAEGPIPTKSGITLSKESLRQLLEALQANEIFDDALQIEGEIARLRKNQTTDVVVSLVESSVDDNPYCLDIREHVTRGSYIGPTRRGFRVSLEQIPRLIDGLERLCEAM